MKRLIFSILFLSLFLLVHAIPSNKYQLVVRTACGDTAFILSQQPEISFTDKDVVVSNTKTTITIPKTEFIDFLFAPYNKRMVRFVDWDGTLLQSSYVNLGEVPEYHGETPYRNDEFIGGDGMLYKYVFCGWGAELSAVTDDVTYTAQYTLMLVEYRVNYYSWDSTLLQSNLYYYGYWPTYYGTYPEREADAQYSYTFTGWSPELSVVTGNQSYYAQYEETLNQYEVRFYDWDGTLLQSEWVNYGEMPSYTNATPTRESDAQYTYTFTGWDSELNVVTGAQSYTAQYEATINQYEVTFYNWDGTLLQSSMVNYDEWPNYYNSEPWREADAQYTYTFTGWSPQLDWVTGVQSYTAQYEATLNQYEVTFYNWDGTWLQSDWYYYGDYPSYISATPTRESDVQFTYSFIGWDSQIDWVSGNQSYYAQYEATLNQYEVRFYDWDGTLLQSEWVNYGEMPSYTNATPTRESDAQYTYTFTGWDSELNVVTGAQSYTAQYEATINQYEVTFYNWDGTLLQSDWYYYGDYPSYISATPTRESDVQFTYTFTGWSPQLDIVTGAQSYTAQYESTLNQYEVTFYNWDGSVHYSGIFNYGDWPVCSEEFGEPTKPSDAQYTYTFTGWGDMSVITGAQSYTAQYEATLNQYEVTFYNWDGTLLQSSMVNYGEMPSYNSATPTREADAQFTYTFTGWDSELSVVTGAQSYTAQYESTLNQYEVTFYNWDGTLLESGMVNYGEMPVYNSATPTREADVQFTYTFTGWGDMSIVTGAQSYTAQYEATLNQYEVTFYNWDGSVLQSSMVNYGEIPSYNSATPIREADVQYTYTFTGWSPELSEVTGAQSYTAQYEATLNQYEVTFYNWDGSVLQSTMVNYGEMPVYNSATPTREADVQYTYTFSGWDSELNVVTGNQSYTAQYEATLNQYEITFYNWDGSIHYSGIFNYGDWPVCSEEFGEPTRPSDAQYTYTFIGWGDMSIVTGAQSYTAQYESTLNQYEVTFYNWDGSVLQSTMVNYGEVPSYNSATPTRESDAQYTYTFNGWGDMSIVTGNQSYTAQYEATLNQYEVTFYNWDGTLLQSTLVNYGEMPLYTGATPTREADAQYTYTFTGWGDMSIVTGNQSYYAQYEATLNQYEVTFYNWDGTLLQSTMVNYGEMPSYNSAIPTRESDAQYTYTFTGWDNELNVVTGVQSYTAQYEATLNQYEVTFYNWDGSVHYSAIFNYGDWPVCSEEFGEPTKPSDAQYTYTFTGWGDMNVVTGAQSYTAQYESTLNQYEVTFYNWDGSVLQSSMVNYGEMPSYNSATPTREADVQFTYSFIGWDSQIDWVSGNQSYYAQYEATLNQYEVTFYNWNGDVLQSTMVNYGEMPVYNSAIPTREADAQYTYTFIGWGDMSVVTGAQSYTAQYEATLNQYEVTFYNWDGTLLQSTLVNYGEMPSYNSVTPTREADVQFTYTFTGWGDMSIVTGNQSYYAQYEATLNQYEVTFYNWDGTLLQSTMVSYGEMPVYTGATPTRESDAQYTYTFTGWSPELSEVVDDQEYTAQYEATLNQYEITFYNWDGSIHYSGIFNYGDWPVCSEEFGEPTRPSDAQYTYTFIGWGDMSIVTGAQSYTAQYEATINQYEVTFYNWDGTLLQSDWYYYGDYPSYISATPTRESDVQFTYTFTGWSPQLDIVTGNQSYYAQYEATLNQYEVTFYNWDGTLLQSTMVNYGEMPVYTGATPTREADVQFTYTFTGWSPQLDIVTGAQSYTAQYEATLNQYEVIFYNWDGSVLQSTMVNYGEVPSYNSATPTRESDAQYTYTFIGWGDMSIVTGVQSYTAQYESTLNQYEVTFYNWDGSVHYSAIFNYGDWPVCSEEFGEPTRPSDVQYTYTFTGWGDMSVVTGAQSYTAQYEATLNQYEVTFYNWDGSVLQSTMVNYGEMPSYNSATPTREADAQFTYTFTGWGDMSVVTGAQSYTAQYESTLNQYEVTFYNWDGSVLQSTMVNYGEMPVYIGATPTREADAQFTYTFTGWSPELSEVTGAQSYTAQYEATLNQYEVTFYNWDGTLLQSTLVNYGEMPSYNSVTPTREADVQFTYTFTGWGDMSIVTGNQSYYAQYEATLNQYEVTFYNWDGTLLQSTMVSYGEMPVYTGATPTRESDAQYTYTFTGWSPELSEVVDDQEYTAQYDAIENDPTSMDEVSVETIKPRKVLIDEKVYIIVGETIYSAQGQKIR